MSKQPPTRIALDHDDYHAQHVGRTSDGQQFFLTTPFIPSSAGSEGREFLALYLFDERGRLVEARIDDLGNRAGLDGDKARALLTQRLAEIGPVSHGRIEVSPFSLERFGTTFGLVLHDHGDSDWWAEMMPGNYMAFHEPWDSGEYDT
jgi:hypothetical protein